MRIVEQIWNDIRQGENIDLYLTVMVSVVLATLNIFGLTPTSWLTPITLAVLALIVVSNPVNRRKLENLLQRSAESPFLSKYPSNLRDEMNNAKELWMMGINLARTIVDMIPDLEDKIVKGDKFKVLLVNPGSNAIKFTSRRLYWPPRDEMHDRAKIEATLSTLGRLWKMSPIKLRSGLWITHSR